MSTCLVEAFIAKMKIKQIQSKQSLAGRMARVRDGAQWRLDAAHRTRVSVRIHGTLSARKQQ